MSVVVIGVNHRTAPLELLERVAIGDPRLDKALADVISRDDVSEAVVLSTCNRTEVYVFAERFHGAFRDVRDTLCETAHVAPEHLLDHLYVHYDDQAVSHLFSVVCGLDSAVLGEHEIQGQVKLAWERSQREGAVGVTLNALFRHALEVGKRARTETAISRNVTSISRAAVAMADRQLGSLAGARALVIGAGDMGRRMLGILEECRPADIAVANRTDERARELADSVAGRAVSLGRLAEEMAAADVVLASTAAPDLMVEASELDAVMEQRAGRPLLIVDIAVPRDIDPAAADIDGITILDMDDLNAFVESGVRERLGEVGRVEAIIESEVDRYRVDSGARAVAPLVSRFRARAEELGDAEIQRFAARLADLDPGERRAVEELVRGVVAKLLHEPTVRLKDAAGSGRGDRLAEALRDLYDL